MTHPPTERLDLRDASLLRFTARVLGPGSWKGKPSLILDRTAFYPESGGQAADHGALDGHRVIDVQVDDDGVVHHVLEPDASRLAPGAAVDGVIDAVRRRFHQAQHTGQHMLSAALHRVAGARTVSSRLGEAACTIDVDRAELPRDELREVERQVNEAIDEDVEVRVFFPGPDELARLPLRKPPKVTSDVRIVAIGDFDMVACGGTHCARTGQVGLVALLGAERYKGMTRVTFVAGRLARELLIDRSEALRQLGTELSCGPLDVPAAVAALRRERDEARAALAPLRDRLADETARALLARPERPLVIAVLEGADRAMLRAVGSRVAAEPGAVACLAAPGPDGIAVLVSRGREGVVDCGALMSAAARAADGRGGGKPDHAEGRLPAGADWPALVRNVAGSA
jgi:alanyl-tRNA synthetase